MAQSLSSSLGPWALVRIFRAFGAIDYPLEDNFVGTTVTELGELGFKERVDVIADALAVRLPEAFPDALALILQAAARWEVEPQDDARGAFAAWPLLRYVRRYGADDRGRALDALIQLNALFSAELEVREYLAEDPEGMMGVLETWAHATDPAQRRVACEATRARLPWATRLPWLDAHPERTLALVEHLLDDPEKMVRTSVANHLNDLSKDHPELALATASRWLEGADLTRRRLVQRGLRTLVRQGHPGVWALLGYTPKPQVEASELTLSRRAVDLRKSVAFAITLTSTAKTSQRFVVDYVVHYVKAHGGTSAKVYTWRTLTLAGGKSVTLEQTLSMMPRASRTLYAGEHQIEVRVNAKPVASASFTLRPF